MALVNAGDELLNQVRTLVLEAEDPKPWEQDLILLRAWETASQEGREVILAQAGTYLDLADASTQQGEDPMTRDRMYAEFPKELVDFMGGDEEITQWFEKNRNIRASAIRTAFKNRPSSGNNTAMIVGAIILLAVVFYNQ